MLLKLMTQENFKGAKAVVASPSVGNIGQLAVDLFIKSLRAEKVGSFWHEAILPLAGCDPYNNTNSLCSANDIYFARDENIIFVQLRASLEGPRKTDYLQGLVAWLIEAGVGELIILAGMFSHQRDDEEMKCGSFRYATCPLSNSSHGEEFKSLGWYRMRGNDSEEGIVCPHLPGAGFTKKLFNIAVKNSLPTTAFLYYCLEGDNLLDSIEFTKKVNLWLKCIKDVNKGIKIPPSWEFLFGNPIAHDTLF